MDVLALDKDPEFWIPTLRRLVFARKASQAPEATARDNKSGDQQSDGGDQQREADSANLRQPPTKHCSERHDAGDDKPERAVHFPQHVG